MSNMQISMDLQRIATVLEEILKELKKEKEPVKKSISRIPYKPVRIPPMLKNIPPLRYPPKQKQKLKGTGEVKK